MSNFLGIIVLGLGVLGSLQAQRAWELRLVPGPAFSKTVGFGPWSYTVTPQAALWVEDAQGNWVADLFVTPKAREKAWISAPGEGRPEALPVWSHKSTRLDAVAGASPQSEGAYQGILSQTPPGGRVVLEVNRSYDFNAWFPEKPGLVNGQPSVIYAWTLDPRENLPGPGKILGQGDPLGQDGRIRPGVQGLDSALELFSTIELKWKEP